MRFKEIREAKQAIPQGSSSEGPILETRDAWERALSWCRLPT
jgi:hypothetical protein